MLCNTMHAITAHRYEQALKVNLSAIVYLGKRPCKWLIPQYTFCYFWWLTKFSVVDLITLLLPGSVKIPHCENSSFLKKAFRLERKKV
uniref:Uncharacterized protein n=1 Tax=Pyxicephalus adspersus TaxID=30357 RepID=A0AAV2ZJM9_PYXAD|nr:TPA: hypothetical protein GDO54_005211 [Pyxicephalus adspersus]